MKFPIKDFFSKSDQIRSGTFTEEILNGKLYFLCSVCSQKKQKKRVIYQVLNSFCDIIKYQIEKQIEDKNVMEDFFEVKLNAAYSNSFKIPP